MTLNSTESAPKFPCEKPWCDEIIEIILNDLESDPEEMLDSEAFAKPYLINAMLEIVRSIYPLGEIDKDMTFTPFNVGALLGHKFAMFRQLKTGVSPFANLPQATTPAAIQLVDEVNAMFTQLQIFARESCVGPDNTFSRCFSVALQQPCDELTDFLEGFNKALKTGSITQHAKPIDAKAKTQFCILVLTLGKGIEDRFSSITDFYNYATKLNGHDITGSLESFQQYCRLIGLKLASRGHPKAK